MYYKKNEPSIQILNRHFQAQVLRQRNNVQLFAFFAHRLHLAGTVGGHVQVHSVRQEREKTVTMLAQVA